MQINRQLVDDLISQIDRYSSEFTRLRYDFDDDGDDDDEV